ncbi:serotriflin-like [Paramacrobiotus metropolitanus]|uniref:serotriflin-like n=1 Tax=Paramacrobiotus metropolitanus TaxID=2943436 RepID=UPI002445B292|nr:serotriflin-like [Paramacrobiotus metropolitanus]
MWATILALTRTYLWVLVVTADTQPCPFLTTAEPTPPPGSPKVNTKDPDVVKEILEAHNVLRAKIPSTAMFELTWDADAAADAATWTSKCVFRHPSEPGDMDFLKPKKPGCGQNLFANSGDKPVNWTTVVGSWYSEIKNFKLGGKNEFMKVGHYTQVVWNDTYSVGCYYRICDKVGHYFACNYYPAGNINFNIPYEPGPACLKCPKERDCNRGLCTNPCKVTDGWNDCQSKYFPDGCPDLAQLNEAQRPAFPNCNATCQCKPKGLLIVNPWDRSAATTITWRDSRTPISKFWFMTFVLVSHPCFRGLYLR